MTLLDYKSILKEYISHALAHMSFLIAKEK